MLRTERQRHVEADGRAAGAMITLKVRDLAGQRLELAGLGEEHQEARHRGRLAARPARRRRPSRRTARRQGQAHGRDALPQLRPPRHGLRRVRRRPAARPFQPGLCRSLAARCQMARDPSPRRRDPRPLAPDRATSPRKPTTAIGRRAGSRPTAQTRSGRINGICRTGARCMSSPTARRKAASPTSMRTSPSGSRSRAATTR